MFRGSLFWFCFSCCFDDVTLSAQELCGKGSNISKSEAVVGQVLARKPVGIHNVAPRLH